MSNKLDNFDWENKTWNVLDSYFSNKNILVSHHLESYNYFISEDLPSIIQENNPIILYDNSSEKNMNEYHINFNNIYISKPVINENDGTSKPMSPFDARIRNLTYSGNLYIDINQKIIKKRSKGKNETMYLPSLKKFNIGKIPIMVNSQYCILNEQSCKTKTEMGECEYDMGGYFIVNGNEKVIICQERKCENKIFVFPQSKTLSKYSHVAEVTCVKDSKTSISSGVQVKIRDKEDSYGKTIKVQIKNLRQDLPLFVVFRALGVISDKEIVEHIVLDVDNHQNKELIDLLKPSIEEAEPIQNSKIALEYISKYTTYNIYMKNGDSEQDKINLINNIIIKNLFPHLGDNNIKKAYYLGLMTNKLLQNVLGKTEPDDRDSFINKRIETTGDLLRILFRNNFNKMIKEMKSAIDKDLRSGRIENYEILGSTLSKKIKSTTIETGMKYALATGNWGLKNHVDKKGIAQVLQRLTYLGTLSNLRRVESPILRGMKATAPRKLANTHYGIICPAETPEGQSVGIVKNLSLMAHITIPSGTDVIISCLEELNIIKLETLRPLETSRYVKIFVNGNWLGIHKEPNILLKQLKNLRRNGVINIYTSISWYIEKNELHIQTDGGRISRPLYIVENNKVLITNSIADELKTKKKKWHDLLLNYLSIKNECDFKDKAVTNKDSAMIEYIDQQEADTSMFAMTMNNIIDNSPNNDSYYNYTHCEIHPSMILGVLVANIPFPDHNQAPRNLFQGAMGKQAIGIYTTNFRKRMDTLGHILHYPQQPLVNTRSSYYVNSNMMPSGQNIIVAIACYTGYNQEDSLIVNQSAIDRGMFISSFYRTHKDEEKKNQSTLEEEKFCMPEKFYPNGELKTEQMKYGSYENIDDDGFIKVGATVNANDIIIGKVIPLKNSDNGPKYRDASTTMRQNETGIVDHVYSNKNGDGYRFCKVRIRSNRKPVMGDKFACYTPEHEVLTEQGWKSIVDITMRDKVASLVDGKRLKYVHPKDVMSYDCDEEVYEVNTAQVNLKVTKNHRLWIGDRTGKKYSIRRADECYGKRLKYMKNCEEWEPNFSEYCPPEFKMNEDNTMATHFLIHNDEGEVEKELDMNAWLTFFGIWMAEGCMLRTWGVSFATHKQRVKDALENCNKILGLELHKHKNKVDDTIRNAWCFNSKTLVKYMKPLSVGAVNKSLPGWAWYLTREQSKILIEGMECGDGHIMKNGTPRYDTSSVRLADDYQKLCLHAGFSASLILKYKAGHESYCKPRDEVFKSTADAWRLTRITTQNKPMMNKNIKAKTGEGRNDGYVHYKGKVYCCSVEGDGIIYVRKNGKPVWCGQSRHGQKGTIGITYTQQDMPFTKDGIVPDIIVNPHAIPSRMTVAQLIECVLGKTAAELGVNCDATPFTGADPYDIGKILTEKCGMHSSGTEVMYNGKTGEQLAANIFIGPTYYYRLKHLVEDKVHSRSTGPYQLLTRQPAEGRSRDGGLRIGEMERDCMLSHGTSQFLKERLFDNSDKYLVYVCQKCGLLAVANSDKNIFKCTYCTHSTGYSQIQIPYASKLLLQELMCMSITPRIFTNHL